MYWSGRLSIARARAGVDLSQVAAAERAGLTPATLCCYERGRVNPSAKRTWRLLERLALGDPIPGTRPVLLVSFRMFGQRFATWRGRLLMFQEVENAERLANEFEDCQLERVVIVPCWPSRVSELLGCEPSPDQTFEASGIDADELVQEVLDGLACDARAWLRMALPRREEVAA
jgi:transcriptional regulator with XRE-family HTH domain